MADLPHATRITMLLREFNRSDHDLCSSYFQPMDPIDLTYEKIMGIVNRLYTSFRFGSLKENHFKYLIFILGPRSPCHAEIRLGPLSLLDKKPDEKSLDFAITNNSDRLSLPNSPLLEIQIWVIFRRSVELLIFKNEITCGLISESTHRMHLIGSAHWSMT
ncbi:unnamed protein product [Hymenolepis diminuta]|uniref:Uncharacterized protein n=1 Tax=Hymenolepis diminuta TaxID=6216 RepID=A0A564YJZ0_HYMDI|nr:unnamed protein product [Hymenolepis diminuta]